MISMTIGTWAKTNDWQRNMRKFSVSWHSCCKTSVLNILLIAVFNITQKLHLTFLFLFYKSLFLKVIWPLEVQTFCMVYDIGVQFQVRMKILTYFENSRHVCLLILAFFVKHYLFHFLCNKKEIWTNQKLHLY